ncbi:MAG TPA: ATP-grasp domain-containing protein [Polyangiaceae bacterium]|nr:ATP-grasp domain-containing protein [Polyangiaceae bacterium]
MITPAATRILIVGCGFPQLGLLRFCRAEGLFVVGLDQNPRAVGRDLCDAFAAASTTDADGIARAVREHGARGLTTGGSDHAVIPTARAAEALGLPFYAESARIAAAVHKDDMRALYARGGAPSPAYRVVASAAEAAAVVAEHGLPVVLKPARGWGQRGVRVVMRPDELAPAIADALGAAGHVMDAPRCVLEAFIEGREFSFDAYTRDGATEILAVTERIITGYPDPPGITFAEVHPPELADADRARVEAAAVAGLRALGYRRGPSYTQVRCGPRGAFVVETALRLGGGLDPDVTLLASGVSLYRRIVGVALGREDWERAGPEAPIHGGATGRFLVGRPGRVRAVRGLDAARAMPGVVDAQAYVGPGDTVHPLTDGAKRAGHVLACGASRAEAEARAAAAMALIEIDTTEAP